jgi:hypothetical protein
MATSSLNFGHSSLAWSTVLRRAGDLEQRRSVMRRGRSLLWHTGV